jgi:hypothetical protein
VVSSDSVLFSFGGRPRFLRLTLFGFGGLLSFISECSFGGIRRRAPSNRFAPLLSSSGFVMTDAPNRPDDDRIGDWPIGRNKIDTPRHVHAFGMIALNAAMLEEILLLLLLWYLRPIPGETATQLIRDMNNRQRADWLRNLAQAHESDEQVLELMLHAIKCCDICFDNRNMLIHALYAGIDTVTAKMKLTKRSSNDPLRQMRFELSTDKLREIADAIGNTVNFMIDLWTYHTHRPANALVGTRLPLPEKPAQPSRLTIPQPEADD